ncbi:hypothetical protein Dsin_032449 [Dipteronia sinensis]|uniref:Uncharacterized protein n=1 Tax=Dipteronia sinensis TaxID=43782 RepID=A0AAE0DT70_9ROSI|nr:hypothetical protein Dsin_032449 [Dipteronia sinensis]
MARNGDGDEEQPQLPPENDIFDGIFRCYAVLIALFVVLAETEWRYVIKFWKVLEYWAGRGMLQIFVAVMTMAFPNYSAEQTALVLLRNIASYMLLGCGLVYVISVRWWKALNPTSFKFRV